MFFHQPSRVSQKNFYSVSDGNFCFGAFLPVVYISQLSVFLSMGHCPLWFDLALQELLRVFIFCFSALLRLVWLGQLHETTALESEEQLPLGLLNCFCFWVESIACSRRIIVQILLKFLMITLIGGMYKSPDKREKILNIFKKICTYHTYHHQVCHSLKKFEIFELVLLASSKYVL